ncbi:5449_t:CDS:1, partial [Rhizophagus irregularis]
ELLIKKADTIQHLRLDWEPVTEVLSHLVNLKILDMDTPFLFRRSKNYANPNLNQLEEISLPALKILKANLSSHKILIRLIETANVQLTTIGISHDSLKEIDEIRRLTQTIYQNCPNLRYIKLPIKDYTLTEFERLLANSQYLDGLVIDYERGFDYKDVFEILTRSSPLNLSKFKFIFTQKFRLNFKLLESFLNKWNDRQPMLLQISLVNFIDEHQWYMKRLKSLIKKYEMKGIIKKFDLNWYDKFEEFEWVQDVSQFYSLP